MSLRRLLPRSLSGRLRRSLSTAVAVPGRSLPTADLSARLRRSLSTSSAAATHPPWAIIHDTSEVDRSSSAPGARFRPVDPPGISHIFAPAHLIDPTERPTAGSSDVLRYLGGNLVQLLFGSVGAASDDVHLLLSYHDLRAEGPCTPWDLAGSPEVQRFVCNPLTGQMLRLPDIAGSRRAFAVHHMGLLTQADGGLGCGPPDRFAVAEFVHNGAAVVRFLSEEGKWKVVRPIHGNPSLLRPMRMNQETVAFGGRLWWVDLTLGAVSVDPFADRPEIRFVELPSGSVLPAPAPVDETDPSKVGERTQLILDVANRRRIGVCEGRLRYAEVSPREPFLLSSYALDDEEGSGWKLEQQVALRQVLADGGYPWQENSGQAGPQIAVLDPLNASAIYLKVGEGVLVVDIHNGKVIGAATPVGGEYISLMPCVLPPWLGSSRIPTAGKDVLKSTDDLV
ncbi:uncharacterized protein LOC123397825 isoform X1 [Hordeum vulgare subsp. vulgare]|uniref:uncharacterized protein LOC123397825 isoform X1 n=1 Tax=Hordeum vulgare subsp. vulgare TaxID=112509 RepID=UPI001D1A539B|nr:uncharacterized protein LOC123397825 isoform X1 [Hordeum vulgare subsp. vulgare]